MRPSGIITLLTDFGLADGFVGQLKGVILEIAPQARVVDVSHLVAPQDVGGAAWLLETSCRAFAPGTVHVAVVDPGVGSGRAALAVRTDRYWFVAPDNGLLTRALGAERVREVRRLVEPRYRRETVSTTFEGRDVFAPAAAWLSRGEPLERFGPAVRDWRRLDLRRPSVQPGRSVRLPVVAIDRFGNVVLDLRLAEFVGVRDLPWRVVVGAVEIRAYHTHYAAAQGAGVFLCPGSSGYLELALTGASAAAALGVDARSSVELIID